MRGIRVLEIESIGVFDNASRLHSGQRKGLCHKLQPAGFYQGFVEDFAIKVNNGSVPLDGACPNVDNVVYALDEWDLYICLFAPIFGEDLDPVVIVLVYSSPTTVVAIYLAEQNDRRRSWSFRLADHL